MTKEEQEAGKKMQEQTQVLKIKCYDFQKSILQMSPDTLKSSGFKTKEQALLFAIEKYSKEIRKIEAEFFKAFPD